jgi:hypothetical protein
MNKYCVLRRHNDFKVIYMDKEAAANWRQEGWELRAFNTNDEAQSEMERWKTVAVLTVSSRRAS